MPRNVMATTWTVITYCWTILKVLIAIAVTLACFSVAEGKFQTVVVCLLVAIYAQLLTSDMLWGRMKAAEIVSLSQEFVRLRRLLRDEASEDETASAAEFLKSLNKSEGHLYINWLGYGVIYLIVLWNLIVVAFGI